LARSNLGKGGAEEGPHRSMREIKAPPLVVFGSKKVHIRRAAAEKKGNSGGEPGPPGTSGGLTRPQNAKNTGGPPVLPSRKAREKNPSSARMEIITKRPAPPDMLRGARELGPAGVRPRRRSCHKKGKAKSRQREKPRPAGPETFQDPS